MTNGCYYFLQMIVKIICILVRRKGYLKVMRNCFISYKDNHHLGLKEKNNIISRSSQCDFALKTGAKICCPKA